MKSRSAKSKGRRLQQEIRDAILAAFPELAPADVQSIGMGQCGMDVQLSTAARARCGLAIEARNREALNVWQAIRDAERHAAQEGLIPCAVLSRNRLPRPYAVVPFEWLLSLLVELWEMRLPA